MNNGLDHENMSEEGGNGRELELEVKRPSMSFVLNNPRFKTKTTKIMKHYETNKFKKRLKSNSDLMKFWLFKFIVPEAKQNIELLIFECDKMWTKS
ncbi:CLUMA_CG014577, isoform A [Clunio marinus]|uniref:CLUMA_CG014577, isoform A n=1 Tax=Clunio marinus TaxID=568069 RepID=A0A1J1IPS1_9DIPT|nr:CLUMA_CG014577, isoform A [Clunio marinus]